MYALYSKCVYLFTVQYLMMHQRQSILSYFFPEYLKPSSSAALSEKASFLCMWMSCIQIFGNETCSGVEKLKLFHLPPHFIVSTNSLLLKNSHILCGYEAYIMKYR